MSPTAPPTERAPPGGGRTIQLLVRSLSPTCRAQLESVVDSLDALVDRGVVAEYDIDICGRKVPTAGSITKTSTCRKLHERVEELEAWAKETDRSLDPVFEHQSGTSKLLGEDRSGVVLPTVTLIEYEGNEVTFVAPSLGPDGVTTVDDRLEALRNSAVDPLVN